jgi:hypothetical protein
MTRPFILFLCAALVFPLSLGALTIDQGRIRLVLHEDNGRFSLYYLEDIRKEKYVSLLFERDPRTSSTGLLWNNRTVTLGSSNDFTQKLEKTVDGARFIWTSPQLRVSQSFSFVKSNPADLVDGVAVTVDVINLSEQIQSVGIYFLFDTYLGESGDAHFMSSDNEKIETEKVYNLQMPLYWLSPAKGLSFKGFHAVLKGNNVSIPDRVVFSNWKRLSETLWNIEEQSRRNFNLLPYSINDSAVAHFYDPIKIASGAERKVTVLLGALGNTPLSMNTLDSMVQETASIDRVVASTGGTDFSDLRELARQDLIAVNDIIANIDSLLSFPEEVSQEKIEVIRKALNKLNVKKSQYLSSE